MSLEQKIARGFLWKILGKVLQYAVTFLTTVALARLLAPKDFGTIVIAMIFIQFLRLIKSAGVTGVIIQRHDINDVWLSTSFFVSIFVGAIFSLSVLFISPLIAEFFNDSSLVGVLHILSFVFIVESTALVHQVILQRKMSFKKVVFLELVGTFAYGVAAIVLAVLGYGVYSFAWGVLAASFVASLFSWIIVPWRPGLHFDTGKLKVFLNWGVNITAAKIALYIRRNVDRFIIGRYLGPISLGYYSLASKISSFFHSNTFVVIFEVMFPAVSKAGNNNDIVRKYYLRIIMYLALFGFPFYLGLFILSKQFILFVYGPKWIPSVAPLRIFCILGIVVILQRGPLAIMLYSKGRVDLISKLGSLYAVINIIAVAVGVSFGIVGVAFALTISEIINFMLTACVGNYLVRLSWGQYFRNLLPIIVSSMLMACTLLVLVIFTKHDIAHFLINVIVAGSIYFFCLRMLGINIIKGIITMRKLLFLDE